MATETRTLVERWLEAGDSADLDAFDACLHHDVVVHAPLGLSTRGLEAEKDVWRAALDAIPDLRHAVQEVVVEGATVAVRAIVTGTLLREFAGIPATGRVFEIDQMVFAHVRDGKLKEIWEVADVARILRNQDQ